MRRANETAQAWIPNKGMSTGIQNARVIDLWDKLCHILPALTYLVLSYQNKKPESEPSSECFSQKTLDAIVTLGVQHSLYLKYF